MRALRENAVPSWLLSKAAVKRHTGGHRRQKPRAVLLSAFRIARALIEGEPLTARVICDRFGVPWPSAKRMMIELTEAYGDRIEERYERRSKYGKLTRVIQWRKA